MMTTLRGNLPAEVSSFIGREGELAEVARLLASTRLLTLVGPGGVGKTRLALRVHGAIAKAYADGVWLVDLGELREAALLPHAIWTALGLPEREHPVSPRQLTNALRDCQLLIVLDDCERLLAACADITVALLRACPRITVLATSREPLDLEGEVVWRVSPLGLPPADATDLAQIGHSEAVRLFVARVSARSADFSLTPQNVGAVIQICRRLGGLPLALEVVAGRVPGLGLSQIATRLDTRYALRVSGTRGAPARHRTLRASLDWSYKLLRRQERVLFRRLAVFVGGWTLDAAEVVCADELLPSSAVADVLERLVSRSIVEVDHQATPLRYRMLDVTRRYASELLEAAHEQQRIERQHAAYVLALAARTHPARLLLEHALQIERDQGNLRAAMRWALQQGEAGIATHLGLAAYPFWYLRGRYAEGQAWLTRCLALEAPPEHLSARASVASLAGHLALLAGELPNAQSLIEDSLEAQRALGNLLGVAVATHFLSLVVAWRGDLARARLVCGEADRALQRVDVEDDLTRLLRAAVLNASARFAMELSDERHARQLSAEAEALARAHNDRFWLGRALLLRGLLSTRSGQTDAALHALEQAVSLQRDGRDNEGLIESLCATGVLELGRGAPRLGWLAFAEAVRTAQRAGSRAALICSLEGFAQAMVAKQPGDAVRLIFSCETMRDELGCPAWPLQKRRTAAILAQARATLNSSAYAEARADGRRAGSTDAVRRADELARGNGVSGESSNGPLTPRENEVAVLLAHGLSNKQIAAELSVSLGTVRSHVDHILTKLALHSRAQVAVWAIQRDSGMPT